MIYVRDYRTLGGYAERGGTFREQLEGMKGRTVTIFTADGRQFTGLLLKVMPDRVKLVTSPPAGPRGARCRGCARASCRFGSCATILLRAVTAVSESYL